MEWVRSLDGVTFINDSKSTTAESARWALNNTAAPVVMICGGRDKNIDFSPLREIVGQKVKKMIVFGEAAQKILDTFQDTVTVEKCVHLKDAVFVAKNCALKGDSVVFSPMCSSFDMFANYEERGQEFKKIVNGL